MIREIYYRRSTKTTARFSVFALVCSLYIFLAHKLSNVHRPTTFCVQSLFIRLLVNYLCVVFLRCFIIARFGFRIGGRKAGENESQILAKELRMSLSAATLQLSLSLRRLTVFRTRKLMLSSAESFFFVYLQLHGGIMADKGDKILPTLNFWLSE